MTEHAHKFSYTAETVQGANVVTIEPCLNVSDGGFRWSSQPKPVPAPVSSAESLEKWGCLVLYSNSELIQSVVSYTMFVVNTNRHIFSYPYLAIKVSTDSLLRPRLMIKLCFSLLLWVPNNICHKLQNNQTLKSVRNAGPI